MEFLSSAFSHIGDTAQSGVLRRLRRADASNVDALLHELLVFEVCRSFGFSPEFEPNVGDQTPDLRLNVEGRSYLADVFVTTRPTRTLTTFQGFQGFRDGGEAAKKIADTLALKATKYRATKMPLLLFVVLVGHDVGLSDLETALFGTTIGEMTQTGGLRDDCHRDWHVHGLFCPPGRAARHRNITAVVSCDWFDSLARTGRRLHCVVYHHWRAEVELRTGAFGPFPDVHFLREASGRTVPAVVGTPNLVMSTDPQDEMRYAPYSAKSPW